MDVLSPRLPAYRLSLSSAPVASKVAAPKLHLSPAFGQRNEASLSPQQLASLNVVLGPFTPGERVLDLGAGYSGLAPFLAEQHPDVKVIALDHDPRVIAHLSMQRHDDKMPRLNLHPVHGDMNTSLPPLVRYLDDALARFKQALRTVAQYLGLVKPKTVHNSPTLLSTKQSIPLLRHSVDKVILSHHVPSDNRERQELLWSISNVLRPGGQLLVVTPQQRPGLEEPGSTTGWRPFEKWQKTLEHSSGFEVTERLNQVADCLVIKAVSR
jgi:SAM-dependent methyltransferase